MSCWQGTIGNYNLRLNLTVLTTRGASDGLAGNKVSGLVYADSVTRQVIDENGNTVTEFHDESIFVSHSGQGPTRPGVVAWDINTDTVNGTYQIDKIPSNDVRSIAPMIGESILQRISPPWFTGILPRWTWK